MTINGEAFQFAHRFLIESEDAARLTGRSQVKYRLSIFRGFEESSNTSEGEAHFTIIATSEIGIFEVPLELKKRQGSWNVIKASVLDQNGFKTELLVNK